MFESGFTGNNNLSLRMRSRHASCGSPGNIFGGFGASIHMDGEVGFETEPCHNQHENSINGTLPFTPELGKWYNFAYYVVDSVDKSSVKFRLDIDGQTVHTGSHDSPQPDYLDEATFLQESSVWLRMNNDQQAVLAFKDFKVIAQEPGSLDGGATTTAYARSYRGRIPKSRPRYYPYFYTQPTTNYMAMAGKKRRSHAPGPGDLACIA